MDQRLSVEVSSVLGQGPVPGIVTLAAAGVESIETQDVGWCGTVPRRGNGAIWLPMSDHLSLSSLCVTREAA